MVRLVRCEAVGLSYIRLTHISIYDIINEVIKNFANKLTRDVYDESKSRVSRKLSAELHNKARRLLDQINAAPVLDVLRVPPGNRLEKLAGNFEGFWSVRINDQWRVIFRWLDRDAYDVEIIDYHR